MMKIKKAKKCTSCGILLQSEDNQKTGYIDHEILDNDALRILYCNDCFDQKMDQIDSFFEPPVNAGFYSIINDAIATDALIVYVLDLANFEESFNHDLTKTLSDNKANVLVLGVKRGLLPAQIDEANLLKVVKKQLKKNNLAFNNIAFIDSLDTNDEDLKIFDLIRKEGRLHDVYIIGPRYAGKTAFINTFLKNYQNKTDRKVVQYNYPGTTLRVTEIPLGRNTSLFDTPGLGITNSLLDLVERPLLRLLRPRKRLEKRSFSLGQNYNLYLGGFVRIEHLSGRSLTLDAYVSGDVVLKRVTVKKDSEHIVRMIRRKDLSPTSEKFTTSSDFDVYEIELKDEKDPLDIVITGLGWVSLIPSGQVLRLYAPRGVAVGVHPSKILKKADEKETKK